MQSQILAKSNTIKQTKPTLVEDTWNSKFAGTTSSVGNLEEALRALTEAEHLIRTQAEHIRQLENMAMTDELTGLLNRRGFTMSLQRELAMARRDATANGILIMVDLDGFKSINDQWGHNVGDDYLQAVAHTLLGSVRTSDIVARLGGDEFVVLFPRMNKNIGLQRLEKLDKYFNSRIMQFGERALPLRASFGLSAYTGADTTETVLADADLKLYAHKASRRNRT